MTSLEALSMEFFGTEDGEPWLAFTWGQHSPEIVATQAARDRILREASVWHFDEETTAEIVDAMSRDPEVIWIRPNGTSAESGYSFCAEQDTGAQAVTGWKLS